MKGPKRFEERPGLALAEEAFTLLRSDPLRLLAPYWVGTVPFLVGFLYFWAAMSQAPDAFRYVGQGAWGLALLFTWAKVWQSVFARGLWGRLTGSAPSRLTAAAWGRMAFRQALLQPWGLFLIPLSAILFLPFAWVYAFFQDLTVLETGEKGSARALAKEAGRQAGLWPLQNHLCLLAFTVLGLFVSLDLLMGFLSLPQLLKSLFGVETDFSRDPYGLLNTTFYAVLFCAAYLLLDPLLKAAYTLRCFYGRSLATAEDLKAELSRFVPAAALAVFGALALAAPAPALAAAPALKGPAIDRSLEQVIGQREFRWHEPRQTAPPKSQETSLVDEFLKTLMDSTVAFFKKVGDAIDRVLDWISEHLRPHDASPAKAKLKSHAWDFQWIYAFFWGLIALVTCALGILLYRFFRTKGLPALEAAPLAPVPDVADEKVTGGELPTDEWARLARELRAQGNLKLALRAFYLACLSDLLRNRLLTLARFKTTLEYERELRRKAHQKPPLITLFEQAGAVFEKSWYGPQAVTPETLDLFSGCYDRLRALSGPQGG